MLILAASACLIGLAGCGKSNVDLVPVDGTVTLDGQPVADAGVMFVPKKAEHGLPAAGSTDANGHFALSTANRPGGMIESNCATADMRLLEYFT